MPDILIAGVVLRDKTGRYLLVQERKESAYGLWNIPAGHVDEGEDMYAAAIREAKEETGFTVELISQEPLAVVPGTNPDRMRYAYSAKITGGELAIPKDEILDAKWLEFEKIKALQNQGKIRSEWVMEAISKVQNENIGD